MGDIVMRLLTLTDLAGEPVLVNIEHVRAIRPYAGDEAAIVFDNDHCIYVQTSFEMISHMLESCAVPRDVPNERLLIDG